MVVSKAATPDLRSVSRAHVRHFQSDFRSLQATYPDEYPRLIVRGEGAYLYDDAGRAILDGGVHLGACQIGHGRAEMAEAIAAQIDQLEFVGLESGVSHPLAAELAERLAPLVPISDPVFSFCNSGSEANDLAFKIARAYHALSGRPRKVKILSRNGSYHGSTFGAVSATGLAAFRELFEPTIPGFVHIAQPSPGRCGLCAREQGCSLRCAEDVERAILQEGPDTVAALIGEPVSILQAVKVPHRDYWPRVREICDAYDVLLIADEVVTGFGRTGRIFACEHWDVRPDVLTMAKGITSGYVPLGATVVSRAVNAVFEARPLLHINTYAGHPAACAAALKNLEILERERLVAATSELEGILRQRLEAIRERSRTAFRVSAIGLLSSIEFTLPSAANPAAAAAEFRHRCYEAGVGIRVGAGDGVGAALFYPPLVLGEPDVDRGVEVIGEVLDALEAAAD